MSPVEDGTIPRHMRALSASSTDLPSILRRLLNSMIAHRWGKRQGPFVPGEPYEPLNTSTASRILPSSVQEIVKLSLFGTIEERIKFL